MDLLKFLMESFINAFGITRPRPEQQRTAALVLGGVILFAIVGMASLLAWMLYGVRR